MPNYQLITRHEAESITCAELSSGTVCWFSARSPDKDTVNEDAILIGERGDGVVVLALADGVGGQPGGAQAAQTTLTTLATHIIDNASSDAMSDMINAIDDANHSVMSTQIGSATTLAAVIIDNDSLRSFHIGDSEIFLCGQRGRMKLQTIPHSPTGYAVESGILSEDEALQHEDRHFVSNLVGSNEMRIELGSITKLATYDSLLLCTDGLTDNLVTEEIVEIVRKGSIDKAATSLMQTVKQKMLSDTGKYDDCSFIIYRNKA